MNINRRDAIDARMTAALVEAVGVDFASQEERIAKTASAVKPSTMEKVAGIMIDNPTLENCEDFVRRYMLGELALLPQMMEFSVNIIPSNYDKENESFLTDGTGMVRVKVYSKTIEIPFLIYNGELVPFDIIQMEGQRVPYSRENLVKIISGVKHAEEVNRETDGGNSPYLRLEEHYNTATVPGFMGEALSIRDTHSHRTGVGSMYVTAGDYEYGFEKQAVEEDAISEKSRPHGDLLGMGLFSDKRRKEDKNEEKARKAKKKNKDDESEEKTASSLPTYKVDGSNNIIGNHDLKRVGHNAGGNVLFQDSKGNYYDFFHEEDKIVPINKDRAKEKVKKVVGGAVKGAGAGLGAGLATEVALDVALGRGGFKKKTPEKQIGAVAGAAIGAGRALAKYKKEQQKQASPIFTDLDAILEKVAGINAMTDVQYQAIADTLNKKAHQEYKERLEKIASEMPDLEMTRMEKRAMEEKANQKFQTLSSFKNGDFILFPEIVNKAISLTPAIVFETAAGKMVLANDRRYELVKDQSRFICMKAPTEFKIKMSSVDSLVESDYFILLVGDKAEPVQTVTGVRNYKKAPDLWVTDSQKDLPNTIAKFVYYKEVGDARGKDARFCILQVPVPMTTTREECLELVAKENQMPENEVKSYVREFEHWHDSPITVLGPKSPIIKVTNKIGTRIESNKQYEELMKMASTGYEIELGTEKLAFSLNTVTVKCINPRAKIFDLSVDYKDSSARMLAKRRQDFKAISIGKLKAILYMLKFDGQIINEIIYKSKNDAQAQYPLPANCTQDDINAVFGGEQTNVSKETIKNTISQFVDPYSLARGVTAATGTALLANAAANQIGKGGVSGQALQKAFGFVSKIAAQSGEISAEFEKIAIDKQSYIHQDYAKAFAIGNIFCEKVAHAMKDELNCYPSIKDASRDILAAKPVLEKFAYEITKEKVNSLRTQNNANMEVLCSSVAVLDNIYKIAYELDKAIDLSEMKFM